MLLTLPLVTLQYKRESLESWCFKLYLKSIEIQGFKSFPEKTRLTFDKPVTGIVGPNGSGKSNISDAILWVLGEQSTKSLRGAKMEDVIFGGTQRRNQVGFAEVSLILDNSSSKLSVETSEVMITRRYYRSGESEFYINQSNVRLKDINELLMDTGLGREGYSIIGQGKIAEILSTKSKDRRAIFEEASGISRYRYRKEESERKLQNTDDNLLRIGDKISELEMQVEPLRQQAEVTKKFLLLRDELRGLEISAWLQELEKLAERADKALADHTTAKLALEVANTELEECFASTDRLSEDMRECDIELDNVRELISSLEAHLAESKSEIEVLKSQMESNMGQIDRLTEELQGQSDQSDGVGAQINQREERIDKIDEEKAVLDTQIEALLSKLQDISGSAGESSEELSSLMKEENNQLTQLHESKSRLSALASQAQELFDVDNSVKQKLSTAKESLLSQTNDHDLCFEELGKAKDETESLNNVISGLTLKLQSREKKANETNDKLSRLSVELQTLESKRNMLSEMERDYRGYSNAVKMVMQEFKRGSLKGIHGTVAGLVKTTDKYTIAIETALGGAMQNIVVDNEENGKTAIGLLKRRSGGRATFLPISTIKGNALNKSDINADQGFEGIALDLIEFNSAYKNIFTNLLGRIVIADNINSAVRIAQKHGYKFRVVTLDGQVINAGGSMTGGSTASSAGILSRANELEQHNQRIKVISEELSKVEREHSERLREKNAAQYELDVAATELNTARENLIKLESDLAHHVLLLQAAQQATSDYEAELISISDRMNLNNEETNEIKISINEHDEKMLAIKKQIEDTVQGQEKLTQERDNVNDELSKLRSSIASLDAEKDAILKSVMELTSLRDEMLGTRERQKEVLDELKSSNEEFSSQIQSKERVSAKFSDQIEEQRKLLEELNSKKHEIESKRTNINKDTQNKNQEMLKLERECSRLEQRKLAAEMEEKQIVDKLWDTYELSRSAAAGVGVEIKSLSEAQRRIAEIKRDMSDLGTVNFGAIEEFERVNTRYTFLTTQRDDVEAAKTELLGIINEITAQMREIFLREFTIINTSFEKTFKELFGGGRASLVLEDEEDVLECGIEINVQPPGKSLKSLTLLSGGEKAFVAIAIYFAILSVRPPPFVVMDEIDAALDDANGIRFATYMRRMSNTSQMIIISHKRSTMEESDVLYGVTMQELGVSSILSIDLDEADKIIAQSA